MSTPAFDDALRIQRLNTMRRRLVEAQKRRGCNCPACRAKSGMHSLGVPLGQLLTLLGASGAGGESEPGPMPSASKH